MSMAGLSSLAGVRALAGTGVDDQERTLDRRQQRHALALDGKLAGLDLGDIENAVDQREQMIGSLPDIAGIERHRRRVVGPATMDP